MNKPFLLLLLATSSYFLAIFYALSTDNNALFLIRDTAQLCGGDSYWGLFSNFGIILWSVASGIAIFATYVNKERRDNEYYLLLSGGLLSGFLAIDDLLMLHETLGFERIMFLLYALAAAILARIIYLNQKSLDLTLFISAAALLGSSIMIDLIQGHIPLSYQYSQIIEEGAKFLGILMWACFWVKASFTCITRKIS